MVEIIINPQIILLSDIMNEIHNVKEAYSSVAKSSIKPILLRVSESLVFLPSFLIFIQTLILSLLLSKPFPFYFYPGPWQPPPNGIDLRVQNFISYIYLPILLFSLILIFVGLILNFSKRFIKFGYSRQISDNDINKRKIIVKQGGARYLIQKDLRTVPYKPHFRMIYIPIATFIIYTCFLIFISNDSGFSSDKTFYFVIQNYVPIVILCWMALMIILLVTNLRKKLRGIKINNS